MRKATKGLIWQRLLKDCPQDCPHNRRLCDAEKTQSGRMPHVRQTSTGPSHLQRSAGQKPAGQKPAAQPPTPKWHGGRWMVLEPASELASALALVWEPASAQGLVWARGLVSEALVPHGSSCRSTFHCRCCDKSHLRTLRRPRRSARHARGMRRRAQSADPR